MFLLHKTFFTATPHCNKRVNNLEALDFQYVDKDGFELNQAEIKFYNAMNYPIHYGTLNHTCWQVPWYTLTKNNDNIFLDHAVVLQRCDYEGPAREQIEEFTEYTPHSYYLLQLRPKWGYDIDINAISQDNTAFEILHIEYDTNDYDQFVLAKSQIEEFIENTDWSKAKQDIWNNRNEWELLKGYDQNNWKAKHILNWNQSEYLEKAI